MLIINERTHNLRKEGNQLFFYDGSIESKEELLIDIPGTLCVHGNIVADQDIEVRCHGLIAQRIASNGHILSMGYLETMLGSIRAGRGMTVKGHILSKGSIFTDKGNIDATGDIKALEFIDADHGEVRSMNGVIHSEHNTINAAGLIFARNHIYSPISLISGANIVCGGDIKVDGLVDASGKVFAGVIYPDKDKIICDTFKGHLGSGSLTEHDATDEQFGDDYEE